MIENQIKQYKQLIKDYEKQLDSETLKKYKILSKANKLGKKIYGRNFTIRKLSNDFEIPYTTTKRVLSLAKANKTTWDLIKQKKISAFKVAMVLMTKDITYQDEIIDMVIKNNLSTYKIKKIRIRDYKDIKKTRTQIAAEKGFSRNYEAYYKLAGTIKRLNELMLTNKKHFSDKHKELLLIKLKDLIKEINKFIDYLSN